MEGNFDLKGFLNDPQVQANKPRAIQYLKAKGIIDEGGNLITPIKTPTANADVIQKNGKFTNLVPSIDTQKIGQQLGNQMQSTGEDVIKNTTRAFGTGPAAEGDYGSFGKNFAADLSARLSSLGHIAGDVATQTFAPIGILVSSLIPQGAKGTYDALINHIADKITNDPSILNTLNRVNNVLDQNPDMAQSLLKDLPSALGLLGGSKTGVLNPEISASEGLSTLKSTAADLGGGLKTAKAGTGNIFTKAKDFITSKLGGKTAEQILATPEEKVPTLSADEQKLWYRNQAQVAKETALKATEAEKAASEQSINNVKTQINDLNQKIGETSRADAIKLKEPARQVIRDASNKYVELTGEAADGNPALKKTITQDNLSAAIDSKFEYNPEVGNALKADLGLNVEPKQITEIDPKTKLPVIRTEAPIQKTLTNQQILDKAREIMTSVSKTTKSGGKTYSFAEYQAMQKYSFLMETLGNNGVDMSAANKFWKEWAPVRDRIVREIKPFDETNIQKMPITNTLTKAAVEAKTPAQAASKLDAQNFISELESRMKIPKGSIGSETSSLVKKLEKAKLSKENIEKVTDTILKQIAKDKAEAINAGKLKQWDTLRQQKINLYTKRAIKYLAIYGAAKVTGLDKAILGLVHGII